MKISKDMTALAKHPAFFDAEKKLLAEVLPGSIYRFTKQEENGQSVSIVVSPFVEMACMETRKTNNAILHGSLSSLSMLEDSIDWGDVFREGKKLLEENGYSVVTQGVDEERFNSLVRRLRQEASLKQEEVRPGDCAAAIYENDRNAEDNYKQITTFQVAQGYSRLKGMDLILTVMPHGFNFPKKEIRRGQNLALAEMLSEPEQYPRSRFVRIPSEDHEWLKKAAFFYQGEANSEEGKKIFEKLKKLAETSGRQKSFHYKPERAMMGNVAI